MNTLWSILKEDSLKKSSLNHLKKNHRVEHIHRWSFKEKHHCLEQFPLRLRWLKNSKANGHLEECFLFVNHQEQRKFCRLVLKNIITMLNTFHSVCADGQTWWRTGEELEADGRCLAPPRYDYSSWGPINPPFSIFIILYLSCIIITVRWSRNLGSRV